MRNTIIAALHGVLLLCGISVVSAEAAPRPHIVFLLADDLGWGDVGYHGSKIKTPHIDRLAKAGVRLEQFYVQPLCSPTRAALLTGRYPLRYGLQCGVVRPWAQYGLPLDERTLPQALKAAGYATAIVGKWHIGHVSRDYLPTLRGFDLQYGHYNGMLDYFTHIRDGGHDWHRNDKANYDKGYTTDLIADEAVRILSKHDAAKPLFLYVPFNAPHTPLQVPEKYLKPYAGMENKQRQIYAGMVSCLDDAIGRIVAAARKHLPAENTLIVFCSDNGGVPRLGSNGKLRAGKGTLYEGGVRVPAVMVWKGVLPAGKAVNEPLHIVDIFPTLVKLAGGSLKQPKPLDGHDLWPVITEGKPRASLTIVHNVTPFHAAIRAGDWKLIHNGHVGANTTTASKKVRRAKWELFNIKDDPTESRDRSNDKLDVFDRLTGQVAKLRRQMAKPNIPPNRPPADFRSPKVWGEAAKK
jgi:arylsulfatase A-like enzyme